MLEDVKVLLGIPEEDVNAERDKRLELIIRTTESRLKVLLGSAGLPESLEYIVVEVSVIRFNKIGSEGFSSHGVEGESIVFSDNDFAGFMDDINTYINRMKAEEREGGFKFL